MWASSKLWQYLQKLCTGNGLRLLVGYISDPSWHVVHACQNLALGSHVVNHRALSEAWAILLKLFLVIKLRWSVFCQCGNSCLVMVFSTYTGHKTCINGKPIRHKCTMVPTLQYETNMSGYLYTYMREYATSLCSKFRFHASEKTYCHAKANMTLSYIYIIIYSFEIINNNCYQNHPRNAASGILWHFNTFVILDLNLRWSTSQNSVHIMCVFLQTKQLCKLAQGLIRNEVHGGLSYIAL